MPPTEPFDPGFYDTLMDALPCAVILVDVEGRIIYFNRAAAELTGYEPEEMIGRDCHQAQAMMMRHVEGAVPGEALCPITGSQPWDQQGEITRRDGTAIPVVRKARPVTDGAGRRIGGLQTMMDVSFIRAARGEIARLREQVARLGRFGRLVGASAAMRRLFEAVARVAPTDAGVVIQGETGTGKELIARELHENSLRAAGPWVAVNCGALSETLVEAELFGHVRGAFTGAVADRVGCFEQASGGTLFLDEIGELALGSQVKLLRALQSGEIVRVGESLPRRVDVRVIAATHRDLAAMTASGSFREDLYYRLGVVKLRVPPLRERREDLLDLCRFFVEQLNERYARGVHGLVPAAMALLERCDWPGNVRQLEHALEHAFVVMDPRETLIRPDHLPQDLFIQGSGGGESLSALAQDSDAPACAAPTLDASVSPAPGTPESVSPAAAAPDERTAVQAALREAGGNKSAAARALGLTRAGLYKRLRRLGL